MNTQPPTRILTRGDVERLIDMSDVLQAVETAFREVGEGTVDMPPKIYLDMPDYNGDFRAMPVHVKGLRAAGIKWVSVYPDNPKRGLPSVLGTVIVSDPETAMPLAIMDGTQLTAMRTGASGGVATKYLAREDAGTVGLVGCGVQAHTQLDAIRRVREIQCVKVWGHQPQLVDAFIAAEPEMPCVPCRTVCEAVEGCDIICTTTPVREPLVKAEWIMPGAHINAIGADAAGKQELESALLRKALVVIDDHAQATHSGEVNMPLTRGEIDESDIDCTLGEIVAGKHPGRTSRDQITVFDSTGLAAQDLATAQAILQRAEETNAGTVIHFGQ